MVLSGEDPLKVSGVLKLDVNEAFQFLSYRVKKNQKEREEFKKASKR